MCVFYVSISVCTCGWARIELSWGHVGASSVCVCVCVCVCVWRGGGGWIMGNRPFPWIPAPPPTTRTPRTSTPLFFFLPCPPADTWDFFPFSLPVSHSLCLPSLFPSGTYNLPSFDTPPVSSSFPFYLSFLFFVTSSSPLLSSPLPPFPPSLLVVPPC